MDILSRILGEVSRTEKLFDVDYRAGRTALKETRELLERIVELTTPKEEETTDVAE